MNTQNQNVIASGLEAVAQTLVTSSWSRKATGSIAASLVAVLLTSCSDDSANDNAVQTMPSNMEVVSSVEELPACTRSNEGEQVWVRGEPAARVCVDGKWYATRGNAECETQSLSDKSGVKIVCGGDSVGVVLNGENGSNGKNGENGINGKDGTNGKDGVNGTNGKDGQNGVDGVNGADGKDGKNGADGRDGVDGVNGKDGVDGKDGTNGRDGVDGKDGTNGRDGIDGKDGASCTAVTLADNSGLKILCGGDSVGVVYNGRNGIDGKDGRDGVDGKDGTNGRDGVDGKDGTNGRDGVDGKDGTNGTDGKDGTNGRDGVDGKDGTNGSDGAKGDGCAILSKDCILHVACGKDTVSLDLYSTEDACRTIVEIDSEKIAVSLNEVSGVTQKGPFLMGSKILVREMEDGRTLSQTGNSFNGKILNDNGEFKINARMLVSQYVMLEANGYYRNEVTGENSSSELTLFAITDVNERNTVNVNLLTHLEYERVIYLVTQKKMKVHAAKKQAQKEVFGLLDIDATDFSNSEDLNIAGSSDEDGALLAFSLMFQGDRSVADLTTLLQTIANDMEKDGTWDDSKTRMKIAEWSADADSAGRLATIRNNVAGWGLSSKVPNFEQYVRNFWYKEYGLDSCKTEGVVKAATAGKRKGSKTRYVCKDVDGLGDMRWVIASDIEKDTYGWKNSTDGALKNGDVTGKVYVFDETGSFNGTAGWREAESIEKQYGGCREALYDSIRTDKVYAYYYTCKKSTHTWVREVDYLLIDTQHWPDSTDGKVRWGDSIGVATEGDRICYVWDDAKLYKGWRTGNTSDCTLGLLGCTAKRGGEMRRASSGRYYSCSENSWTEVADEVYINTYLYRCTIDGEGDKVYKDGDLVYGIEMTTTRYACENEQWRSTKTGEEQAGKACTALLQGTILGDTITCDTLNWRTTIVYDYPVGKKWFNEDLEYGTLKDKRDGRTYKTIKIGNQVWMAENLAYSDSIQSPYLKGQSWCYNNDSLNCLKGGRYYTWTAAMNIHYKWKSASPYEVEGLIHEPHQGICPDGWHVPTWNEWNEMYDAIGTTPYAMQAKGQRLWPDATNVSGFSAIPVGRKNRNEKMGEEALFWGSDQLQKDGENWLSFAYAWNLNVNLVLDCGNGCRWFEKNNMISVRCVQDSAE